MSSVFVIGPRKWRSDAHPRVPASVGQALPAWWPREGKLVPWPVDIRAMLVDDLRREGHAATMMELWTSEKKEAHTAKFHRVEKQAEVDAYVVYWPVGGHVEGLSWELSDLVDRVLGKDLSTEALHIFPEVGVLGIDGETGLMMLGEPGHRTTYFQDILDARCPLGPWSTYDELRLFVRKHVSP